MSNIQHYQRQEYQSRINRVVDYIENHLDEALPLAKLAEIAHFSPYHFHRIFSSLMGETLNRFIQRLRIERAAAKLVGSPKVSVTEVALECGFSGSAAFARAFKDAFGMSATEWRAKAGNTDSKDCKVDSNNEQTVGKDRQAYSVTLLYAGLTSPTQIWRIEMSSDENVKLIAKVEVKELPDMEVAYIRHVGPYAGDTKLFEGLFEKLMKWAGARGLINFPDTMLMGIYHDDPNITEESRLRTSICITVPADTKTEGEIGRMKVAGGKYAVGHFELSDDQYPEAWKSIYGGWLPESGYQPDDGPPFEIYMNDPRQHPEGKCLVDICIPVKPL